MTFRDHARRFGRITGIYYRVLFWLVVGSLVFASASLWFDPTGPVATFLDQAVGPSRKPLLLR